jgi:GTP cyclohydrolase I
VGDQQRARKAVSEAELPDLVRRMLELLGEEPERESLQGTPVRVESSLRWLTRGYGESVDELVRGAIFEEPHESMILVRDIEIYSMCEHHMLPFFGKAHVAYIPDGKIIGLSMRVLEPHGVGVVVEAYHLCMMMRGVEKQNSKTVTSALRGSFLDGSTRDEFLRLAHGGNWPG